MQFPTAPTAIHRFFWVVLAFNIVLYAVLVGVILWEPVPAEVGADLLLYFFVLPSLVLFLISLLFFLIRLIRSKKVYLFEVLILLTNPMIFVLCSLLFDRVAYYRLRSSQQEYEISEDVNEEEVLEVESTDTETDERPYPEFQVVEGEVQISPYILR